jgi:hypothetical protein
MTNCDTYRKKILQPNFGRAGLSTRAGGLITIERNDMIGYHVLRSLHAVERAPMNSIQSSALLL